MNPFDLNHVTRAVANTRFGRKLSHFATIDSTNIRAVEAANAGGEDGAVYVADEQTAGRGRGGHSWHSTAGAGLYVSAIVRPEMGLAEALWLSLATGLAAQRAILESTGVHADIRWPNDLLIGRKKCGGILVETGTHPGTPARLRYAVIGIGINVNHDAFPPELASLATSLRIESGAIAPRDVLLANLLLALDAEITLLEAELHDAPRAVPLLGRFTAASSWVQGMRVRVDEDGGYTGETVGLNSKGFLLVQGDDGKLHTVLSGGVRPE
jgi:BirA family transcriptional regulator, biotin operon repressor / biotin---[acetyl-CoA-carboxylase] ligase